MLTFLFPPVCPLCGKNLLEKNQTICKVCSKKKIFVKGPVCYSCGKPLDSTEKEFCQECKKHPKNFHRGIGLCVYQEPVKSSLAAIKYKNKREFAKYYIEETKKRKGRELKKLGVDVVVPVPLHKRKLRKRGFNQAEIFAEGVGKIIGCPVEKNLVKRTIYTRPQKNLNAKERKQNLMRAFSGDFKVYQRVGCPKKILVVDDIYTTGATVQGVTNALLELGVREVYIFCIAVGNGFS